MFIFEKLTVIHNIIKNLWIANILLGNEIQEYTDILKQKTNTDLLNTLYESIYLKHLAIHNNHARKDTILS